MDSEAYARKERLKAVVAVYLLLVQDDRLLMALRQNTGYQDGNWNVPSGHVEEGESPMEALIREVKEEVGVDVTKRNLTLVHTSYRPQHDATGNRIDLFFLSGRCHGDPVNAEPDKCAEIDWFLLDRLPENTTPHVRIAVEEYRRKGRYTELGLEWIKSNGLYKL